MGPIQPIQWEMDTDLRDQPGRRKPLVMRGRDQEAQQALQIQRMRRAADREARLVLGAQTVARGVAQGAVDRDALIAEPLDRQSERQALAFLPGQPESAVTAVTGLLRPIALGRIFRDE